MLHTFISKKKWNPNLAVKKLQPRPGKCCDEKKSKGGGQSLCRNAVDRIKNFDNDDPSHKALGQEKLMFCDLDHHFNAINSIPAQALAAPFWYICTTWLQDVRSCPSIKLLCSNMLLRLSLHSNKTKVMLVTCNLFHLAECYLKQLYKSSA